MAYHASPRNERLLASFITIIFLLQQRDSGNAKTTLVYIAAISGPLGHRCHCHDPARRAGVFTGDHPRISRTEGQRGALARPSATKPDPGPFSRGAPAVGGLAAGQFAWICLSAVVPLLGR